MEEFDDFNDRTDEQSPKEQWQDLWTGTRNICELISEFTGEDRQVLCFLWANTYPHEYVVPMTDEELIMNAEMLFLELDKRESANE